MSILNSFAKKSEMQRVFLEQKKIFFVGIGGIGMQGLALLLSAMGYIVGGSDRGDGAGVARLKERGISVSLGHRAEYVQGYGVLIYTLAIGEDNPELLWAREHGIPCYSRADLLGYIMSFYTTRIAVAGTHGKSTVTAMLAAILKKAGKDPTVLSGAPLGRDGSPLSVGGRRLFLAEACEYKDSFLCLDPTIAVVLNTELDHADYFKTEKDLTTSFSAFMAGATAVVAPVGQAGIPPKAAVYTFGQGEGAAVRAVNITYRDGCPSFDVVLSGHIRGRVSLAVPGEHNMQNALAACAAAHALSIPFSAMRAALSSFNGIARRLQPCGVWQGAKVYLDYAHHPTEIRASLLALRCMLTPPGRLVCVYEPHTYSRTSAFFCGFADALSHADAVLLLDIYAAREQNESGVTSELLASHIPHARYVGTGENAYKELCMTVCPGDVVVLMGAGEIHTALSLFGLASCNFSSHMLQ